MATSTPVLSRSFESVSLSTEFESSDFAGLQGIVLHGCFELAVLSTVDAWELSISDEDQAEDGLFLRIGLTVTFSWEGDEFEDFPTLWISEDTGKVTLESIVGGASSPVTLTPEAAAPILSKLGLL